jgi:hypothetical protein
MMAEPCERQANVAGEPDGGEDMVADGEGDGTSGCLRRFDDIVIRERADHLTAGRGAPFITDLACVIPSPSRP